MFGSVSQIHMSQSSLYLVSNVSQNVGSSCPPGAECLRPNYGGISSTTLVHRFALDKGIATYQNTTTLMGNPLTQYSMDEDVNGNFRIVTTNYDWSNRQNNNSTSVSIINKAGKVVGSISGIGK